VIELEQAMNDFIKEFTLRRSTQTGDYLFANSHGRPTDVSTLRERFVKRLPGKGFHSLRRFRARHLRANNVNDEITKYLLGHSNKDLTSRYSQLGSDADRRRQGVNRVGLGFNLPR
jgi:integrase